jgi:beta-galactosidase
MTASLPLLLSLAIPLLPLCLLCGASAEPSAELIENGDFATAGDGAPRGWSRLAGTSAVAGWEQQVYADPATGRGAMRLRRGPQAVAGQEHAWSAQAISVVTGLTYEFSAMAKAWGEADHHVELGCAFLGADGAWLSYRQLAVVCSRRARWPGENRPDVREWTRFAGAFTAPNGAVKALIRLDLSATAQAEAHWSQVSVRAPTLTVRAALAGVAPPPGRLEIPLRPVRASGAELVPDWALGDAQRWTSQTRERICLNAAWAIRPAALGTAPDAGDWAFIKLPGRLTGPGAQLCYGKDATSWAKTDLAKERALWLVRDLEIPAWPAGRRIELELAGLAGAAAAAFWDGRPAGILTSQWGGRIDLTGVAAPGTRGQLALFLLRTPAERFAFLMEGGAVERHLRHQGLPDILDVQDAFLAMRPQGGDPLPPRCTTSTRSGELTVRMAAPDRAQALAVTVRGADGEVVVGARPLPSARRDGELVATMPWPDARRWSPDDPYLYRCEVAALDGEGRPVDVSLPVRIGFREVWIDGRRIMLNGQELRLRPRMNTVYHPVFDDGSIRRQFAYMKDMGFNCSIRPPAMDGNQTERDFVEAYYRIADEMGMLTIPYLAYDQVSGGQFGGATLDAAHLGRLQAYIRDSLVERLWNHPSVIAYGGFGTAFTEGNNPVNVRPDVWGITPLHAAPAQLDAVLTDARARATARERIGESLDFVQRIRSLDPTRPFLSHFDSGEGDGWGAYDYFNWTPLQEWADWPRRWSRSGVKPIGSTEHGLPYPASFLNHGIPDGDSEPWITEYAALRLGPAAYRRESPAYLERIRTAYDARTGSYPVKGGAHHHFAYELARLDPVNVQEVWALQCRTIYRAWRAYGVPMGIEPFGDEQNLVGRAILAAGHGALLPGRDAALKTLGIKPDLWVLSRWCTPSSPVLPAVPTGRRPEGLTPLGRALHEVNRPLLAFIGGPAGHHTAQDHAFRSGETVEKQIIAVWDGFSAQRLAATWTAELGGASLAGGRAALDLRGGEIRMEPIRFAIPALAERQEGRIVLTVVDAAGETITDAFPFSAHPARPAPDPAAGARIALLAADGAGDAGLAGLGHRVRRIAGLAQVQDGELLVVGRGGLPLLRGQDPAALPAGSNVLVLEQTVAALEEIGLRAFPARHRTVFDATPAAWALDGVGADDLRDWRAVPDLLPDGVEPLRDGYNFHESYRGTVCSVSLETPHAGTFTPLLVCGFDLRETPLMEAVLHDRRWVFCQLSLGHPLPDGGAGTDPVAERILANLVEGLRTRAAPGRRCLLLGDGPSAALLRGLGLEPGAGSLAEAEVAVVVDGGQDAEALRAWVRAGGTAVVLPGGLDGIGAAAGSPPPVLERTSLPAYPRGALTRGLSDADFHYRQALPVRLLGGRREAVAEVREGDGRWVLLGFDPAALDVASAPYLRLTRRHQCRALAQILVNCGVRLEGPMRDLAAAIARPPFDCDVWASARAVATDAAALAGQDWTAAGFDDAAWSQYGLSTKKTAYGEAAIRIHFRCPANLPAAAVVASLGTFDDFDEVWCNGVAIGSTTPANTDPDKAWAVQRTYAIPPGLLRAGADNVLAVRVWNRHAASKGWKAWMRGPMRLAEAGARHPGLYPGGHKPSDDPYLQHHW